MQRIEVVEIKREIKEDIESEAREARLNQLNEIRLSRREG